jgi:3-hydroxyisobutyrate dehydrogenase-like beta-hydroxyacid dehydrogenase
MSEAVAAIHLLGFGEVGQNLAGSLPPTLTAWDLLFRDSTSGPSRALAKFPVTVDGGAGGADLVISAVTAAQDLAAAQLIAATLKPGSYFLDLNSASPEMKKRCAAVIEKVGGRYVEGAVMAPIAPKGIATSILLGGPHAERFLPVANELGFVSARFFSAETGQASAAKMCRSVMIKGIEALLTESMITARHYGVEKTVLTSLSDLLPVGDWPKLAHYMISRSLEHGTRRAEEMREVARTVAEAGLDPLLSAATAERQEWSAGRRIALQTGSLDEMLDCLLALRGEPEGAGTC